ncbi:hypothetical protein [Pseudomonas syringae]|nr:hypothetical protein [Pseudomonas syringae]
MKLDISPDNRNQSSETPLLMSWSLKTLAHSPRDRIVIPIACMAVPIVNAILSLWAFFMGIEQDQTLGVDFLPGTLLIGWAFLAMVRQKTLFNYRVYPDHIESDDSLYYPDYTEDLFKGIVIVFVLAVMFLGIFTGSALLTVFGPVFILVGTGGALMSWQCPEPRHHPGLPWDEFNFVTVDRKYRIIVHHCTDVPQGFDVRFPDDDLLEQYLAFLHTVLRPTVKYTERVWQGNYE